MKEVEAKAQIRDKQVVIAALQGLGCTLSEPVRQEDTLYAAEYKSVTELKLGDLVLRIRQQGNDKVILTGKISVKNMLDKLEAETEVADAEAMAKLLEWMDWKQIMRLAKVRQKTRHGEYEICVDEVEGLGSFIEIEKLVGDDTDSEAVQTELWEFLRQLGINEEDRATRGYDILLGEKAVVLESNLRLNA